MAARSVVSKWEIQVVRRKFNAIEFEFKLKEGGFCSLCLFMLSNFRKLYSRENIPDTNRCCKTMIGVSETCTSMPSVGNFILSSRNIE